MRVLFIDDDPQSHQVFQRLITRDHPSIDLVANGYTIKEGQEMIKAHHPDLVFLDIELTDGLGFDLLSQIPKINFQVIFITAHDKYAISAIQFGALDFLLKPISATSLTEALKRAQSLKEKQITAEQIQVIMEAYERARAAKLPRRQAIRGQQDVIFLPVEKIVRLEAQGVFTLFHQENRPQPIVSSINLGKYVDQFDPYPSFQKIHRSHVINLNYVIRYIRSERMIEMHDGSQVPISRPFIDDFLAGMQQL
ncbi:MAG: LytTR family DNA-binding domain-containing protein [Bacteroidota bacterium]